jgi:hypothetical protein
MNDFRTKTEKFEEEQAKLDRNKEIADFCSILGTPEGRRFIWRLLSRTGWMQTPFVQGQADSTAKNIGVQEYGLWLFSEMLTAKSDAFTQMQREHKAELARRAKAQEQMKKEEE